MTETDEVSPRVLIVEDHGPTSHLMVRALNEAAPAVTCVEVRTAAKALEFLTHSDDDGPDVVLLDLDLPDKDGFDVLKALNSHPTLSRTPVIIVSGDTRPATIDRCYEMRARTFIEKPEGWDEFLSVAQAIAEYWFETATIPSTCLHSNSSAGDAVQVE